MVTFVKAPASKSFNGIPSTWDQLKNLKNTGPKGTPPGTVPIGDSGWYVTPNTPADPKDCVRFPSSPWCGGIPFGWKLFSPGLSVSISNCGFDIKAAPTVFYVKFPIQQLSYRFPGDCRKDPPKDEPPEEPPPAGDRSVSGAWKIPDDDTVVYCFVSVDYRDEDLIWTYSCTDIQCPGIDGYAVSCNGATVDASGSSGQVGKVRYPNTSDGIYSQYFFDDDGNINYYHVFNDAYHSDVVVNSNIAITQNCYVLFTNFTYGGSIAIVKGEGKSCRIFIAKIYANNFNPYYESVSVKVDKCLDLNCRTPNPYDDNPPPEPPDKGCKCMSCCNDPSSNNDSLLKQILAAINKANKAIGSDEWPASVPANILVRQGLSNSNTQLANMTQFLEWYVKQFDAVVGRFSIDIQVDDIDPTKPGNQTLKMNLPNLSESIAEMVGLLLHISMTVDSLQNINIRTLVETGSTKQQGFINYLYLKALSDYMGFPRNDKSFPLTLAFKPNETQLDKLLNDTQINVKGIEYNTNKPRLKDNLQDLLHAAAIIKALHWRKIDPQGDIKSQLFNLIKTQAASALNIGQNVDPKTGKSDFDQFIQDFESGFENYSGLDSDLEQKPYGRPYDQRPQVKKLGDPNTQNNQPGTNT